MKRWQLFVRLLMAAMVIGLVGCQGSVPAPPPQPAATIDAKPKKTYADLIVGYVQLGAESEWRSANTASVKEAAEAAGVELRFSDAQQKQENQIKAIRSLIAQRVDVIGVAPLTETGWTEVFQEAKDAGIPIILVDRRADVAPDLYVTLMGSDFMEEGRKAARIMADLTGGEANIVELVGTIDSAPANDRYKGFREVMKDYPGMKIIASRSGDFTVAQGREVMEAFLQEHGDAITAVYAHNDDMALGAIKAIEAHGLRPGIDIKIVSVDAARGAFEAMVAGKLNATVECNPLLGPEFIETALKVVNGETVPKWLPSEEGVFFPDDAAEILPTRTY
ncbi:MAG: ABC transporter substrate-binding protein [Caldilineales bacterium]|nr:ABC transporter substrate-binding protein [Caldilineales bacterium]MCW5857419.1 ABC transporter substrate-binding protein [Caldilineales bacterium]